MSIGRVRPLLATGGGSSNDTQTLPVVLNDADEKGEDGKGKAGFFETSRHQRS